MQRKSGVVVEPVERRRVLLVLGPDRHDERVVVAGVVRLRRLVVLHQGRSDGDAHLDERAGELHRGAEWTGGELGGGTDGHGDVTGQPDRRAGDAQRRVGLDVLEPVQELDAVLALARRRRDLLLEGVDLLALAVLGLHQVHELADAAHCAEQ